MLQPAPASGAPLVAGFWAWLPSFGGTYSKRGWAEQGLLSSVRRFLADLLKERPLTGDQFGQIAGVALATLAQLAGPGTASCALTVSLSQRIGMRTSCLEKRITRA